MISATSGRLNLIVYRLRLGIAGVHRISRTLVISTGWRWVGLDGGTRLGLVAVDGFIDIFAPCETPERPA